MIIVECGIHARNKEINGVFGAATCATHSSFILYLHFHASSLLLVQMRSNNKLAHYRNVDVCRQYVVARIVKGNQMCLRSSPHSVCVFSKKKSTNDGS